MPWKRFGFCLLFGWLLSVGVACSDAVLEAPSQIAPAGPAVVQPADAPSPKSADLDVPAPESTASRASASPAASPEATTLSAEAAALLAQIAPQGVVNPPKGDVRLAVISDLNSAYGSTDYEPEVDRGIQLIPFWQPDLVICGGDMVAGQKASLTREQITAMWTAFDQHVAAPLRRAGLPLGFTLGNHDASGALSSDRSFVFQQERELASAYWNDPAHDPGVQFVDRSQFPFFYTFAYNDVFFLVWDGSTSQIPADKLAWVEQSLGSDRAQQAKMRILVGHLPLYGVAIGRDQPGEVMANAEQLRAMLERYRVHTYISGHQHAYYPAHQGNLQLLHAGILGAGPRRLIAGDLPAWKTLTVVDIAFDNPELTTYTTYNIQTLEVIDPAVLPRSLTAHNGRILRRDITESELGTSESGTGEQLTLT